MKQVNVIEHWQGHCCVEQRREDGYLDATALCHGAGRELEPWLASRPARLRVRALTRQLGVGEPYLVQRVLAARRVRCWLHPVLAGQLARTLQAPWPEAVNGWLAGISPGPTSLPAHIIEPLVLRHRHFSLHHALVMHVLTPLRLAGFTWPDALWPGAAENRAFETWLAARGVAVKHVAHYRHVPAQGRAFRARLYPRELYPHLREYVRRVWLHTRIPAYFLRQRPAQVPPVSTLELPELLPWRAD